MLGAMSDGTIGLPGQANYPDAVEAGKLAKAAAVGAVAFGRAVNLAEVARAVIEVALAAGLLKQDDVYVYLPTKAEIDAAKGGTPAGAAAADPSFAERVQAAAIQMAAGQLAALQLSGGIAAGAAVGGAPAGGAADSAKDPDKEALANLATKPQNIEVRGFRLWGPRVRALFSLRSTCTHHRRVR